MRPAAAGDRPPAWRLWVTRWGWLVAILAGVGAFVFAPVGNQRASDLAEGISIGLTIGAGLMILGYLVNRER